MRIKIDAWKAEDKRVLSPVCGSGGLRRNAPMVSEWCQNACSG
jgi:hypothetical protein